MASLIGEKEVTDELIPILLELTKDKSSDVKIRVLEGLSKMSKVVGIHMFNDGVKTMIQDLLSEDSWRVRMSVFDLMGDIGIHVGQSYFSGQIEETFLKFFNDKADAVRKCGIKQSKILAKKYGD